MGKKAGKRLQKDAGVREKRRKGKTLEGTVCIKKAEISDDNTKLVHIAFQSVQSLCVFF